MYFHEQDIIFLGKSERYPKISLMFSASHLTRFDKKYQAYVLAFV